MSKHAYLVCAAILLVVNGCWSLMEVGRGIGGSPSEYGSSIQIRLYPLGAEQAPVPSSVLTIFGPGRIFNSKFDSFAMWLGEPEDGVQRVMQQEDDVKLELPWRTTVEHHTIKWPLKVKLVGKKEGKWVVIKEQVFCRP